MKNSYKYKSFIRCLAIIICSITAWSCSDDKDMPSASVNLPDENGIMIEFVHNGHNTRAESDFTGNEAENYINSDDVLVLVIDESDRILGALTKGVKQNSSGLLQSQKLWFKIEDDLASKLVGTTYKLVTIVNAKSYDADVFFPTIPDGQTPLLSDYVRQLTFNFQGTPQSPWMPDIDAGRLIPMFGYASGLVYNLNEKTQKVTMRLQRCLVKIEVSDFLWGMVDPENHTEMEITAATLSSFNQKGWLVPADFSRDFPHAMNVNIPAYTTKGTGLKLTPVEQRDASGRKYNKWVCYVPEMVMGSEINADRPYINIYFVDKNMGEANSGNFRLDISVYNDDGPYVPQPTTHENNWTALFRNHLYAINLISLTKISSNISVDFTGHSMMFGEGIWFLSDEEGNIWYHDASGTEYPVSKSEKCGKEWWYIEMEGKTYVFIRNEWVQIDVDPSQKDETDGTDLWTLTYNDQVCIVTVTPSDSNGSYASDDYTISFQYHDVLAYPPYYEPINVIWIYELIAGQWIKTSVLTD